ncbi:MAG: SGNH/GDSL hydrolase family protein [Planctomycetes bacterium]|nr:SGNH/GDSL hydrolase family protein [Planctomycetota bacterium]MCB9911083.1 SGNH/GDSL hydrolase family protein [Planctomycetota bacterium]
MNPRSSPLKWTWPILTVLAWAAFAGVAGHQSQEPAVWGRWSRGYALMVAGAGALAGILTAGLAPSLRARWVRRVPAILALGLGCLIALIVAEVGLRAWDPLGFSYRHEMQRYIGMRQPDPDLVYGQPRSLRTELDGVEVRFNSLGLRGPEILPKRPGERRILFLGDSVVFGWGVSEADTFVQLVSEEWTRRTQNPWSSVNAGVCSYNTEQEAIYLQHHGWDLAPDLVVLVLIDNDVLTYSERWKAEAQARARSVLRRLQRLLRASYLYQLVHHTLEHGLGGVDQGLEERSVRPGSEGWQASLSALQRIQAACRERDTPLAVFHFRWEPHPWSDAFERAATQAIPGTPILDTAPWFQDAPMREWVNSPVDAHPNPKGHARAAQRMVAALEQLELLPK